MADPIVDSYYFTTQAKRCRQLAKGVDARTARILNDMADEYEAKAIALDERGEQTSGS